MNKALLIIDIQNFYFGENGLEGNVQASLNARKVLDLFRKMALPVFHVRHVIDQEDILEEQKVLSAIHENVRPAEGEVVISKKTPGSFNGTDLLSRLNETGITELFICGMMTHMCVDTTTREAFDLGFKCTVIHDACATRALKFSDTVVPAAMVHTATLASLKFAFAEVVGCDEIADKL